MLGSDLSPPTQISNGSDLTQFWGHFMFQEHHRSLQSEVCFLHAVQGGTVASRWFLKGEKRQRGQCCLVPRAGSRGCNCAKLMSVYKKQGGKAAGCSGLRYVCYLCQRCKSSKEHLSALDFLHLRGKCVVHSDVLANIQTPVSKDVTESSRSIWPRHHME